MRKSFVTTFEMLIIIRFAVIPLPFPFVAYIFPYDDTTSRRHLDNELARCTSTSDVNLALLDALCREGVLFVYAQLDGSRRDEMP